MRGQAAANLLKKGTDELQRGQYADAAKDFNTIVTTYPSTPNIEDITIRAGYSFLHSGDFLQAIKTLAPMTPATVKPEFRGKALFFTGMAQFSQAHKLTDEKESNESYREAEETMATLITFIGANPSADNRELLEDAMYYQALSAYGQGPDHFAQAETDLNTLLVKFATSLQKPDYLLLLGSIYAVQASNAVIAKNSADATAAAQKAIDTFNQVSNDPNALVQANEANMRKAETLYLIAQLNPTVADGFEKALDAFRQVHRKEDMVALQQKRIDDLRAQQAKALENGANVGSSMGRLLDRETSRLADLQAGSDPIVQGLIRMAECFVSMKKPDEARTILHRLHGVKLTDDQQKEVDFQYLFSYTLGGEAEKADAALTDYLAKHPGDAEADSISVQLAVALMKRDDYDGALRQAQRSLKDFPNGKHVAEAVQLESEALTKLKRFKEADAAMDDFINKNPNSTVAVQLLVTKGEGQADQGDLNGALASFAKVKDNPAAGAFQASADAYYINTLNTLKRYKEVVTEAQAFTTKYPTDKAMSSVTVIMGMAMDKLGDPNAVTVLQGAAKKYADEQQIASYALYYVVAIYQRESANPAQYPNAVAQMTKAVNDLRTQFPKAYALISQGNDALTELLKKQKKFDDAVALYQPLITAPLPAVAAGAQNKIGDIWLAAAKAMGSYQSLQTDPARAEAEKRLKASEDAYVATLTNFPTQLQAVGDAFDGLVTTGQLRVHWGLIKETDLEDYLGKQTASLTGDMLTRVELAKAGLVFVIKNGHDQFPAALARFDKGAANLQLTSQEADHYGLLLIDAKRYPDALKVYNALLSSAQPNEQVKLAAAYYGLAATYLAMGDIANAKTWFMKMQALPGGAAWSSHAMDANLGMAQINEQSTDKADLDAAKAAYSSIMVSPMAGAEGQAKALLGYGRILEKEGFAVKANAGDAPSETAVHYYEQVNLFYSTATPEESAQGLYLAVQAYTKAGDTTNAAKDSAILKSTYAKTDWATKP